MRPIVCYSDSEDEDSAASLTDDTDLVVRDILLSVLESVAPVRCYNGADYPCGFNVNAYRASTAWESVTVSSSDADSEDSDDILNKRASTFECDPPEIPVVPGELSIEDLPKIERLSINVGEEVQLLAAGVVDSIVGVLTVVKSVPNTPPLNEGTWLFAENRAAVGQIFETFGPVKAPYYSIRFNTADEIADIGLEVKQALFYANTNAYTYPVFVDALKKLKGCDASWENDVEPPPEAMDFSDDEQERIHRRQIRGKRRRSVPVRNGVEEANGYYGAANFASQVMPAGFSRQAYRGPYGYSYNPNYPSSIPTVPFQSAVPLYPSGYSSSLYVEPRARMPWHAPGAVQGPIYPLSPWTQQNSSQH